MTQLRVIFHPCDFVIFSSVISKYALPFYFTFICETSRIELLRLGFPEKLKFNCGFPEKLKFNCSTSTFSKETILRTSRQRICRFWTVQGQWNGSFYSGNSLDTCVVCSVLSFVNMMHRSHSNCSKRNQVYRTREESVEGTVLMRTLRIAVK